MKKIILYLSVVLFALISKLNAQISETASMSLHCPTTVITPGTNFVVDVAFQYSTNSNGNIVIVVNYDNTKVSFCGSLGFGLATPVNSGSSITYTFPATLGPSPAQNIQMCFSFICPQTCFGTSLTSNFTGNISTPTLTSIAANPCATSGTVLNNWSGSNIPYSYDCINNRITFRLDLTGSTCYKIDNPNLTITPSMGTIISVTTLPVSLAPPGSGHYYFYYTVQLPCTTTSGTLTCSAVLNGDNCGSPVSSLVNFGTASWTISNSILSGLNQSTSATNNSVTVTNYGSLPISINLSTTIPLVNITNIAIATSQTTGLSGTAKLYNCSNSLFSTTPLTLPPTVNIIPSGLISKANYNFVNLMPGQNIVISYTFDKTSNCTGTPPSDCHKFITSGDYLTFTPPVNCNCAILPPNTYTTITSEYCPLPQMYCYSNSSSNYSSTCKKNGDLLHLCFNFMNIGSSALLNGVFTFPLPAYLNYSGNLTFNGSTSSISFTAPTAGSAGNVIVTLPPSIAAGSGMQNLCFDVTVNATAPNGLYGYNYGLSGSNYPVGLFNYLCPFYVRICQDPKFEIEKLVKGNKDATFVSNGSGTPGSTATYQITIKNTGNTPIDNVEIIDRTPETGDKFIRTCAPRNSAFSMFPNGTFNPTSIVANYENSPSGMNTLPSSWSAIGGVCNNYTGSYLLSPIKNTVKINLPSPILPFTNYTFEMQVNVPSTATAGKMACNSIAVKADYLDIANNPYPMEIKESELACLIIAPPPCDNCKELLTKTEFIVNPGTTTSTSEPYVIKTGSIKITISKPVQEIRLSIADLQYRWDNPGCVNCKGPTITRGCLFPITTGQTVGSLVWDDYTSNSIPTTTSNNNCPEELIWKLGVMLVPGTYTIPIQVTLPKSIIPDCCELKIDKFDIKVSLKDKDCKVCDSIIKPSTDNCCTGSYWIKKQMTWDLFPHGDWTAAQKVKAKNNETKLKEAIKFNKQILLDNGGIFDPIPMYGVIDAKCDSTYRFLEGSTRTFSGTYSCNTSLSNCQSEVLISITTISGDFISVVSQPSAVTQIFNLPGVYKIKFVAKCGGKICSVCEYTIIVEKNCCNGITQKSPTTITTNSFGLFGASSSTTVNLASPAPGHYTSFGNGIIKLDYKCATGCNASYEWKRIRSGVVIASGISTSSTISFAPPSSGEDKIVITTKCGTQNCYKVEQFYLGCQICSIVLDNTGGLGLIN